jgi:NlpC/P60 family putative phage cell wall peptidase
MTTTTLTPADPSGVLEIARTWLGTPYLHQSSVRGVGCDCLGLARGIWRALHGDEPWEVPPYSRDWGEAGRREVLAEAARAALIEVPFSDAGSGALVLFRMALGVPAKHCGILGASVICPTLIHAYDRSGVVEEAFTLAWSRRAAFAFQFPATPSAAPPNPVEVI